MIRRAIAATMRARHAELVAEIDEKRVLVRPFSRARGRPLDDELGNGHQCDRMLRVLPAGPSGAHFRRSADLEYRFGMSFHDAQENLCGPLRNAKALLPVA